jgi:hypothetical protein
VALKQEIAEPVPFVVNTLCPTPPVMCVPGATRSGFWRPSAHGPRLEKLAMSAALFASVSNVLQPSLPVALLPPLAVECE